MSDASEKPFDAPPSRIAKAKREGNVPRAQEFGANLAFGAAALAATAICAPAGALAARAIILAARGETPAIEALGTIALALVPMGIAACAAVAGGVAQSGGVIVTTVSLKFDRLQPVEGLKRMFSRESVTHAARAIVAFAIAAAAIGPALRDLAAASLAGSVRSIAQIAWHGALRAVFAAAGIGLLFAFAEYAVARRAWLRKLRMSLAELKRELKESDGDPLARSRRRSLHRTFVRGALAKVKDASFVVVNPTHVAVALDYRPPAVPVPLVLVRAAGEMALRVRELAAEHRIPVIENIALARALYADARAGEVIPHDHYVAVAEVVAALYRSGAIGA